MRDVALIVPLGLLFFGWDRKRDDANDARIERFGNSFNDAAFSGSVPSFSLDRKSVV